MTTINCRLRGPATVTTAQIAAALAPLGVWLESQPTTGRISRVVPIRSAGHRHTRRK